MSRMITPMEAGPLSQASHSYAATEPLFDPQRSAETTVGQIIKPFLLECAPELPLFEAAQLMSEARVSSILVVADEKVLGIWTERDALAVDFQSPETLKRPVGVVMSAPVLTVASTVRLQEVAARFREERVRHYLVVDDDGRRCGIVSQTDLVLNQGIEHYLRLRKLGSAARGRIRRVAESASLAQAAAAMRESAVDAVVVAYADGSHGILTERDILHRIAQRSTDEHVGVLASRPLLSVNESVSLYRVRSLLLERGVRHVGVTDDNGRLVDLVSFTDIVTGMELAYIEELQQALRDRDLALNVSQRHLHLAERIIENSLEGVLITDESVRIISVNPAFTHLTGYMAEEVIGRNPAILSSGRQSKAFYAEMWAQLLESGHWQGEIWNRRKNGQIFPELLTITAITDKAGKLTNYAALFSDISALKENEERIRHLAYYDPLTALPNRRLLEDRLQVAVAHAHRSGLKLAVLFIDLDRFKRINDSLGHQVGDQLLTTVSRRLRACVREDDTIARMGGDEFVALLGDIEEPDQAAHAAHRLIEALQAPVIVGEHELVVTTSIGISVYPDDGDTAAALLKNADVAMYRAKDAGRNSFQLYEPAMNARSLEHLALETALHHALGRGELELHYQPLFDPVKNKVVGAEALLRWRSPELGLIGPADFISLAEESGLIVPIGEWVLRTACGQLAAWHGKGHKTLRLSVNISARQFRDPGFGRMVERVVGESRIAPGALTLELTESVLMSDVQAGIALLERIKASGVHIALDDFGTGYCSLSYLKRFPIDQLKIDRLFVRDLGTSGSDAAIVSAIVGLAHGLGMEVVAEGVETEVQLAEVIARGCDLVQGCRIGAPCPAADFEHRAFV